MTSRQPKEVRSRYLNTLGKHMLLIVFGLIMIYPLLWMISSSLKSQNEIFAGNSFFPIHVEWENYKNGWNAQAYPFGMYLLNSTIISLLSIAGNLLTCSMAAYALSRLHWRGRKVAFGIMIFTLMLPVYVLIVPQYTMWSKLGLVNTIIPLVLPKFLATDSFFTFLMVQFFRGIPKSLDEAAKVDGASYWRIYWQIILPNAVPALATAGIFTFIWTWNDFFNQLLYLTKPQNITAAVALRNFADATSGTSWGSLFAMSTLTLVPVFIVFIIGQKYLIEGVATTGLK